MSTILLCVTGSIAAYKAADLASKLTQAGHGVTVLMTQAAQQLVTPSTFLNLTGNKVYTDLWDPHGQTQHIALTDRADLCVLAPATANAIAKLVLGIADDMVSTTLLALRCPVLVCPAMNTRMWQNPVVQQNVARARELGHRVLEPGAGALACGHVGPGRMAEPAEIAAEVARLLPTTAGPSDTARFAIPAAATAAAPEPSGDGEVFLEMVSYEEDPEDDELEAERRFRAEAHARGALLASGRLGPRRFAHVHRAPSLEEALTLARAAPLARARCSIHVFPWALEDGAPF